MDGGVKLSKLQHNKIKSFSYFSVISFGYLLKITTFHVFSFFTGSGTAHLQAEVIINDDDNNDDLDIDHDYNNDDDNDSAANKLR